MKERDVIKFVMGSGAAKKLLGRILSKVLRKRIKGAQLTVTDCRVTMDDNDIIHFQVAASATAPKRSVMEAIEEALG